MLKGRFITFEGGEGTGKSTQVKMLAAFLEQRGVRAVTTREPGGTPLGEKIREALFTGEAPSPGVELMMNVASRLNHVEKIIKPALAKGAWVISDRFLDSSAVYQGYAAGLGMDWVYEVHNMVLGNFRPDITFVLDGDPAVTLERARKSGETNRYEEMELSFHRKVREGFLKVAEREKGRCWVVDAGVAAEEAHKQIINHLAL